MRSISFPNMFKTTSTIVKTDSHDATYQNILLVLGAEKGDFVFDPYFGIRLRRYLFDQNNYILRDVIIDEIYTQLLIFMPQLLINREDITINIERSKMVCNIKVTNRVNFVVDSYNVVLLSGNEE